MNNFSASKKALHQLLNRAKRFLKIKTQKPKPNPKT
jgi:hypothetical protein